MPEPRLGQWLAALLPGRTATDVFEPAWEDLRIAYLTRRELADSSLSRAALRVGYTLLAFLLLLD